MLPSSLILANPAMYGAMHSDLRTFTPAQAQKHYVEHGHREKRATHIWQIYPDFRAETYIMLNIDLGGLHSEVHAQMHWLTKGRHENRHYKPAMDKEFVYLYCSEDTKINKKRDMTTFGQHLDQLHIPYIVTNKLIGSKSNLYILFCNAEEEEQLPTPPLPFYYMTFHSATPLLRQFSLATLDQQTSTVEDIKRCLVRLNIIDATKIVLPGPHSAHMPYVMMVVPLNNNDNKIVPKILGHNNGNNDATILCIVANAQRERLPYVMVADEVMPSVASIPIIKNYLQLFDEWDLCVFKDTKDTKDTTKTLLLLANEIIELNAQVKLLRMTANPTLFKECNNGSLWIYNNSAYEPMLQSNSTSSTSLAEFLFLGNQASSSSFHVVVVLTSFC